MEINVKLDKSFTTSFNKLKEQFNQKVTELNGFSNRQLNHTDFIDNFVDKNVVADASIDGNANVAAKDVTSLLSQMNKPQCKLLAFNKIFTEMSKKWGYTTASDWLRNEWDGHFYLHDSFNSTFYSYCYAYDIENLVKRGLYFINDFNAQPPQHLTTYVDFVGEFVSWVSNRSSGACGLPSFLIYSFYFWKKDVETNYQGLNTGVVPGKWNAVKRVFGLMKNKDAAYRKKMQQYYRDQQFQRIIYKLNQPYLRVNQSAFTNFSIFDKNYLVQLFGGKEFPDGSYIIDYIDDIVQYQKAFMEVVSEVRAQNMMTFPVLTFALLRYQNGSWGDEQFAKWCCKHNMKWNDSNFYISSSVTTLSNCCILGSSIIKVIDNITQEQNIFPIHVFVEQFNNKDQQFITNYITNYSIKSFNYQTKQWQVKQIQGLVRKANNYDFMFTFTVDNRQITVTPDHKMQVIDIQTKQHKTITAAQLSLSVDKYLILLDEK